MLRASLLTCRLFVLLLMPGMVAGARAAFELIGEIPATSAGALVTVHRESLEQRSSTQLASAPLTNGRFHLRLDAEPGLFSLHVGTLQASFVAGDKQTLRVSAASDGSGLRVEGSRDQMLFESYESLRAASLARTVMPVREAIRTARAAGNETEVGRLTDEEVAAYQQHRRELNDFTLENLRGSPALYAASLRWDGDYRLDELARVVEEFSAQHPETDIGRLMKERIARFRATAIGAIAPPLSGPSPNGDTIDLADLRGRYVLVDFWASWCSPCRIENRHYVELYRRHRADGFEILAVSVDQNERAWKTAIAQDKATWLHLSDLTGWSTPLAARYNVTALPASFLLDPDGRIIAKDARGEELARLIATHLGTNAAPRPADPRPSR